MRILIAFLVLLPAIAGAELLPEALGEFERKSMEAAQPAEAELDREFGFEQREVARYVAPDGSAVQITATLFADDTGAFSAFQWSQPARGEAVELGERALKEGDRTLIHFGNYVVEMQGAQPLDDNVELMLTYLPRMRMTADPPLVEHVPDDDLIARSQRHILGPVALEKLAPEVPPSVAAFRFGTEAQFARYQTPEGELRLLLFGYPSPQIARGQIEEFNKLGGGVAKRVRSMIAFVAAPASPDAAERLLAKVQYSLEVTMTPQERPGRHDNLGNLIFDIVLLCVVLVSLMIVGGLLVAGARIMAGRYAPSSIFASHEESGLTRLDIDNIPKI
jgi:hypothetical protein